MSNYVTLYCKRCGSKKLTITGSAGRGEVSVVCQKCDYSDVCEARNTIQRVLYYSPQKQETKPYVKKSEQAKKKSKKDKKS